VDTDPAVAATAQTSAASVSRTQTVRRSRCADGHPVRAAVRHPVGDAPAGNGLRLRHELLAPTARLAASRSLGSVARSTAGQIACGRSHRLVTCHRRFFLHSCCGIRSKTGPNPTDRARPGSKHHLVTEAQGIPLALILTGANRHDVTQLLPLIDAIPPIRGKRGRPLSKPAIVQGDRGYDHDKYRRPLHAAGISTQIARRGEPHGSGLGKTRWVVERTIAWLHNFRRLRVRFERLALIHEAFMKIAACIICWRRLQPSLC
jgi:transposase